MWIRGLFLIFMLTGIALPAAAFERNFPPKAKTGTMSTGAYPEILINGQPRNLSAGAQIRNADNLIQVSTSLDGQMTVKYTENAQGDIDKVWILTPGEAEAPARTDIMGPSQY